jgi:predicted  nucleic acid-binding Zn-ribbon protein
MLLATPVYAQEEGDLPGNTVFDRADALTDDQEREVEEAFQSSGYDIYAYVEETPVSQNDDAGQQAYARNLVNEESVPDGAGVVVLDPENEWFRSNLPDSAQGEMRAEFGQGDWSEGLIAGAEGISGGGAGSPGGVSAGDAAAGLGGLGAVLLLGVAGVGAVVALRRRLSGRREGRRRLAEERTRAEEGFAALTARVEEFNEKERLVSGYLEAQRPLLDQETEEELEARIREANAAPFGSELNEAAAYLESDPTRANTGLDRGREQVDRALRELDEVESVIDDYRAADERLDGHLREAADEISHAEAAEERARGAGAAVPSQDSLRPEFDLLAREVSGRAANRDEFDPREAAAAVDALAEKARSRRAAMEDEVNSKGALPHLRSETLRSLDRASRLLEEHRARYAATEREWGPAALEDVPAPAELETGLHEAHNAVSQADRLASSGRFAEARGRLERAQGAADAVVGAPAALKKALVEADRKKREGEDKIRELETRLKEARKNRHRMNPRQQRQLRDYERRFDDARGTFFGGDLLTALLLFEVLDNDTVYMGGGDAFGGGF